MEDDLKKGLRKIFNKYDIMNLIKLGAPKDEYDPEIKKIALKYKENQNLDEFTNIVAEVFEEMFGSEVTPSKRYYKNLAQDAFNILAQKRNT